MEQREPALFLHLESESFTAKVKASLGLEAGLRYFLCKLREKRGVEVNAISSVELRDDKGTLVVDAVTWQALPNKADVFVVLASLPDEDDDNVGEALKLMSEKNYKKAKELLEKKKLGQSSSWALAETLRLAGKYDESIVAFKALFKRGTSRVETTKAGLGLGLSLSGAGRHADAVGVLRRVDCDGKNPDVATALGFAYLACDEVEEAVSVIEKALGMKRRNGMEDDAAVVEGGASLVGPTRAYAACAAQLGQFDQELHMLLQASVSSQGDADVRRDLGRALDRPGACLRLQQQLKSANAASAAAFGYLAIVAKDNGAVSTAVTLLEWAAREDLDSATYALNLMHALEIVADSGRALGVGIDYFRRRRGNAFADACLPALLDKEGEQPVRLEWTDDGFARVVGDRRETREKMLFDAFGLDFLAIGFVVAKLFYLRGDLDRAARLVAEIEPFRRSSTVPLHTTSIRNENAYYGCLAQILAVEDNTTFERRRRRRRSPSSTNDPARPRSTTTTTRAYVCGDSHALSPAWKRYVLGGEVVDFELRPALVTGLKHWHLRPESVFYPKRNFYSVFGMETARPEVSAALGLGKIAYENRLDQMDVVPDNSIVVFVLGEIDCREGILVAIQKLRYRNLEEGIDRTSQHFVKAAEVVVREKKLRKAFVHPVPPVLDETRPIVVAYNARLKYHVNNSDHLHWLDFFDELLTVGGDAVAASTTRLKPEYEFDGTHLNPSYVDDLLVPSLVKNGIGTLLSTSS